ncbi:hypothetical protein MAM1_0312c09540 [Mucor ambiguus]|uniref:sn-1-specific diacylglycerol lipase n=1 Tax=Mucor ambiguus TaxID=91626 RepID=A0A0C9MGX3_9FUNG|nr:hypothetical protein MAM1_0312c09540 [Mucor ambiguus]
MVVSTQQLTKYSATIYNASPTLLPENIASLITAIALAARLSLRCSSLFIEALLESAKYSTSLSFGLSRQALINALSTAKKLHELTASSTAITTTTNGTDSPSSSSTAVTEIDDEKSGFLQMLDKYTNLGVYIVHHTFTLAELFALSGLQFTSNSIKYGLMAAEESVGLIDGIFGSNESSRAIASIITLVHRELMNDPDFPLTKIGKVAILSGLTKAMTAFAVLQNVTHKRTMKHMKIVVLWKGLVVEEEESSRALIQYQQSSNTQTQPLPTTSSEQQHTDVIHELEEILANTPTDHRAADENDDQLSISANNNSTSLISLSSATNPGMNGRSIDLSLDDDGNPYNMYEITTTTNRITTRTTRIRPIDVDGNRQMNAKQVVERTNEEDNESFIAVIDHQAEHKPRDRAMIMSEGAENAAVTPKNSWDHANKGHPVNNKFRIMLSSVSKKLSRKKVERQTKYGILKSQSHLEQDMEDTFAGPITTVTSTSTTLQQQQSSTQYVASTHHESSGNNSSSKNKPLPNAPTLMDHSRNDEIEHDPSSCSEPESKPKRRMSWSGLKMKSLNKKKSVTNLFQKGDDTVNTNSGSAGGTANKKKKPTNKHSKAPPVPTLATKQNSGNMPYLQKSNSINSLTSLSSIARTLKTTTYYTSPASSPPPNAPSPATPSTSRSLVRSPSVPAKLHSKIASTSSLDQEPNPQNFPRKHIISNIAHFIRYASAAYGESFMRILGIGKIPSVLPNSHHPNHHAFAHHTGVSIQDILLSSYTDNHLLSSVSPSKMHALVHYVTVDHYAEAIVLTCRGTLGLGDVLTDLTCDYREFTLPTDSIAHGEEANGGHQRTYVAHGGMLEAAQILAVQKGKVFEAIKKGLESYPHYGLVLCGHSLGAGVASLLSVLWSEEKLHFLSRRMMSNQDHDSTVAAADGSKLPRKFLDSFAAASIKKVSCPFVTSELSGLPAGRPIHCYTYGSPCVMSLELSQYCTGLVTSVVHGNDIVSGLSLGLLKDFKNIAVSLHEDSHVTDEILSRVIGHYHRGKKPASPSSANQQRQQQQQQKEDHPQHSEEDEDQWFWALIKTFRADMLSQKLFPPSTMYLIESVPQLVQHAESNRTTSHPSPSSSSNANTRVESKHKRAHMVKFSRCDDIQARFSEIVFSRTMFMDHSPNMYEKAIQQLNKVQVTHAIVKILLFTDTNVSDYFFSFTENAYGISIVADEKAIEQDFLPALEAASCPALDVANGVFRVLQVDEEYGQELGGKRISEISEPLAEGRFSILYISTYQTDFVLVSEPKLYQVMQALRDYGCDSLETYCESEHSNIPTATTEEEQVEAEEQASAGSLSPVDPTQFMLDINVLENDLQCVGLNRHHRSGWVHTVLKTLCYPDLVHSGSDTLDRRFCSFVNTNEDVSLIADTHILDTFAESTLMRDQDAAGLRVIQVHFSGSNIERCGIVRHVSKPLAIEAKINMFYLSTFKTANIIVSTDDLDRAVAILAPSKTTS